MLMFTYRIDNEIDFVKSIKVLRNTLKTQLRFFGERMEAKIRKKMSSGSYAKNSPPWMAAKGGKKVFYNTGHMQTSLRSRIDVSFADMFVKMSVGWLDKGSLPSGFSVQERINRFSTGAIWNPTNEQRRAFWAKVPKAWKAANRGKLNEAVAWFEPRRDFMGDIAKDPDTYALFLHHVDKAVLAAMKMSKK